MTHTHKSQATHQVTLYDGLRALVAMFLFADYEITKPEPFTIAANVVCGPQKHHHCEPINFRRPFEHRRSLIKSWYGRRAAVAFFACESSSCQRFPRPSVSRVARGWSSLVTSTVITVRRAYPNIWPSLLVSAVSGWRWVEGAADEHQLGTSG